MDTKKQLHSQQVYFCDDDELVAEQTRCLDVLYDFNHTRPMAAKAATDNDITFNLNIVFISMAGMVSSIVMQGVGHKKELLPLEALLALQT